MLKRVTIVVLCFLLTACSAFGFLFERLPWLTRWQFDRMFELTQQQEELVESGAYAMQQWLVDTGFPLLIRHLDEANDLWQHEQYGLAARQLELDITTSLQLFFSAASPYLSAFLLTLNEDNAHHFRAYNEDQQNEWFAYAESENAKQAHRLEKLEDWFGKLDRQQQLLLTKHITLQANELQVRLANNHHWKERLLDAALNKDELQLLNWLNDFSIWWTDDYRQLRANNRLQWHSLLEALLPTLSIKQKQRAAERVGDWIDDLKGVL